MKITFLQSILNITAYFWMSEEKAKVAEGFFKISSNTTL